MSSDKITITFNDKQYSFDDGDFEAIKKIDWQDRKKLIQILESIKQAEYVNDPQKEPPITVSYSEKQTHKPIQQINQQTAQTKPIKQSSMNQTVNQTVNQTDPKDIDTIMNQLIMEEQKNQTKIPDRGVVLKWIFVIISTIILLALIF